MSPSWCRSTTSHGGRFGQGADGTLWCAGPVGNYRRQFEKTARNEPSIFAIDLETLAVKAFGDMGPNAQLRIIWDRFIAGNENCALWRHLDRVPPDNLSGGRAIPTQMAVELGNRHLR